MTDSDDGAATAVDLIEPHLDRLEELLARISARAQELEEGPHGDPES